MSGNIAFRSSSAALRWLEHSVVYVLCIPSKRKKKKKK
jgi:hypothetical protein